MIKIQYKNQTKERMLRNCSGIAPYLYWERLGREEGIVHGFSTREGGVSGSYYSSMNLGMTTGDSVEHVRENFRRITSAMQIPVDSVVSTKQTHTTNVRLVSYADAGNGILRDNEFQDIDGLITNEPGLALACFGADCVPLYLYDPVTKSIGLSHSGWRGTVGRIGAVTLHAMQDHFGTNPADVLCAIGPSICQDCYEVSEDVIEQFRKEFALCYWNRIFIPGRAPGKYQLNLWEANKVIFEEMGVPEDQILISDICTCCNPDLLFSHRATGGKRGNNAGFLMLK